MKTISLARLPLALLFTTLLVPVAAAEKFPDTGPVTGPTIGPTFTPHPYETRVKMKNGDVSVTSRFRGCGTSFTTEVPAFTFTLTEPMTDLRVWIDAPAVLVMPAEGSPYVCVKGGVAYYNDWPAGTYEVYLFSSSIGVGANIRVEMPKRARIEADAAVAAAPLLDLDPDAPDNPRWLSFPGGSGFRPELAGVACGRPGMTPLARLPAKADGKWTIAAARGRSLYLTNPRGGCMKTDSRSAYHLKADQEYVLWGWRPEDDDDAPFEVVIEADDRPRRFSPASAPTYELGALEAPLALPSTLKPVEWAPHRLGMCWHMPRTPSFFVKTSEDLGPVSLEPLRHRGKTPKLIVYGPLEDVKPYRDWNCDETTKVALPARANKTWAVFVLQKEQKEAGAPIVTIARRLDRKPDPMAAPVAIPDELAVNERRLGYHYPFYGKTSVERFFLEAPERLFVWLGEADGELVAHEPLALIGIRDGVATVARFDGTRHEVALAALSGERPEAVALPRRHPPVKTAEDLDHALSMAGPADKDIVDKYTAAEEKFRACVGKYMAKHDPSWGKSYELIYVNSGRNVTDVWFRRADKACNYAALEAHGKRLTRAINRARKKSAAAYLKALKARFAE